MNNVPKNGKICGYHVWSFPLRRGALLTSSTMMMMLFAHSLPLSRRCNKVRAAPRATIRIHPTSSPGEDERRPPQLAEDNNKQCTMSAGRSVLGRHLQRPPSVLISASRCSLLSTSFAPVTFDQRLSPNSPTTRRPSVLPRWRRMMAIRWHVQFPIGPLPSSYLRWGSPTPFFSSSPFPPPFPLRHMYRVAR